METTLKARKIACNLRVSYVQRGNVRKVAVALGVVQAVADRETVGDLEADVARTQVHLAPGGLGQQRAHLQRGGVLTFGRTPKGGREQGPSDGDEKTRGEAPS